MAYRTFDQKLEVVREVLRGRSTPGNLPRSGPPYPPLAYHSALVSTPRQARIPFDGLYELASAAAVAACRSGVAFAMVYILSRCLDAPANGCVLGPASGHLVAVP